MPDVLQTKRGAPARQIAGVCLLPGDAKGGVLLDVATESLAEFQDGDGKPLTATALKSAAREFAEARDLQVTSVSEAKVEKLAELAGAAKDRPPASEVAAANHEDLYGEAPDTAQTAVENTDPTDTANKEG